MNTNTGINKSISIKSFVALSFFSPVMAAWFLFQSHSKRLIVVGSTVLMGIIGALFNYSPGSDGYTHYERSLEYYSDMSLAEFFSESKNIILQQPSYSSEDLYIHLLCFLTNSLLGFPKTLHFFAGLLLGFVIGKSVVILLYEQRFKLTWKHGLPFLVILLAIHSVYSLNAIRISTGGWVMFLGALSYLRYRRWKYLLLILLSIQIHLANALIAIPVIAAILIGKYKKLIVAVFVGSFFFQLPFVSVEGYLPTTAVVESKVDQYVVSVDSNVERTNKADMEHLNWYTRFGGTVYYGIALPLLLLAIIPFYLRTRESTLVISLIGAALLLFAYSNVVSFMPSLQGRVMNNASIFLLSALLLYHLILRAVEVRRQMSYLSRTAFIVFFALCIPLILYNVSHLLNTVAAFILVFPILTIFVDASEYSIRNIIGDII